VSKLAEVSVVLVVHPSVQARTVKELIALARANPGKLNMALPGVATPPHLLAELFRQIARIRIDLVPYKGGGPALIDVVSGQVDMIFQNLPSVLEFVKAGRVRSLALASERRSELLPDTPTLLEVGVPATATGWMVLVAPAGTPAVVISRLNAETTRVMSGSEAKQALGRQGATAVASTPAELTNFLREEIAKWAKVVKDANIRLE